MKKLSIIVICTLTALFFVSCQTGKREDCNGNTPSSVVEKMYQAIMNDQYEEAASYCKIPETVDNIGAYNAGGQSVDWKHLVISRMIEQAKASDYTLQKYEIVTEEISNTDPNSAKVKTKIFFTTNKGDMEAECSFPLKRENNVWLIIG